MQLTSTNYISRHNYKEPGYGMLVYPLLSSYIHVRCVQRELAGSGKLIGYRRMWQRIRERTMYQWQGNVVYIYQLADMTTAYIPNKKTAIWDNWQTCMEMYDSHIA